MKKQEGHSGYFQGVSKSVVVWGMTVLCGPLFAQDCSEVFLSVFQKVVNEKGQVLERYKHNEGYLKLSDELQMKEMIKVYRVTRGALKGLFKDLHWKMFQGTTDEFKTLRETVLDESGRVQTRYQGSQGQLELADRFYGGKLRKTSTNVSVVISNPVEYKKLGWRVFKGSTREFRRLRSLLVSQEDGSINKKYVGQDRYVKLSDKMFGGDMNKTFTNAYAVVEDPVLFQTLQWRRFNGSTERFKELRVLFLDPQGGFKKEWAGQEAYLKAATGFFEQNMTNAFRNVSALASRGDFRQLRWRQFIGLVSDFHRLRALLFDKLNGLKPRYIGTIGLKRLAEEHFKGKTPRAYGQTNAVLTPKEFKLLQWKAFVGKTDQIKTLHSLLLDRRGNIKEQYMGQEGYIEFVKNYPPAGGRDMWMVWRHVNTMGLSRAKVKQLGWYRFQGTVSEFRHLQSVLLDEEGQIRPEWTSEDAYTVLSTKYAEQDMNKTFINVRSVLGAERFALLGWRQFQGSVSEFQFLKNRLLDEEGNPRPEQAGQETYLKLVEEYSSTHNMRKTFRNASIVMGLNRFRQLGWKPFYGTVEEYRSLKARLAPQGKLLPWFRGTHAYLQVSSRYFNEDMNKAYINTTAFLDGGEIEKTEWRLFPGTTRQFMTLRIALLNGNGHVQDRYTGLAGYVQFSMEHFGGNMRQGFLFGSAVINSREEMRRIRWNYFNGTVQQLKELRGWLLGPGGQLKPEWKGYEGQTLFAGRYFGTRLKEAFAKTSVALGSHQFASLQWKFP